MSWSNPRWCAAVAGLFLAVFALAALSGPGRIDIVDGQTRYEVARSLVDHGDSIIRDNGCWMNVYSGRNGASYTSYRFPQSGLGVVAIWAADATGPICEMRRHFFFVLTSAFAGALLAATYAVWFRGLGHSPRGSLLWALAGFVATPSWYYSTSSFDDILGSAAIVLAVAAAWLGKERAPLLGATIAGFALGWAVHCKEPLALFLLPVLPAFYQRGRPWQKLLLPCAIVVFWLVMAVIAYRMYNQYKFPPGTTDTTQEFVNRYGPIWTANPLPGLAGFALSTSCGVFLYCPVFYLALRGWWVWRAEQKLFCTSVAIASALFTLFLCFITFFKGEPSWGPRYLTPIFALWWVFVPAAVGRVRGFVMRGLLTAGVVVQLLGLSIDPIRLFLITPIHIGYYHAAPWAVFDPAVSHLLQRPREIAEVLAPHEPEAEFAPAPLPTHAGDLNFPAAYHVAQAFGYAASPAGREPLHMVTFLHLSVYGGTGEIYKLTARRYRIYNSLRPWWISQRTLPEDQRPVNHAAALIFFLALGGVGLGLMMAARRQSESVPMGKSNRSQPRAQHSSAAVGKAGY